MEDNEKYRLEGLKDYFEKSGRTEVNIIGNEIHLGKTEEELLDKTRIELGEAFEKIINILKYYVDLKEENYSLIALWIIGANMINAFNTYPYLYLNAPKGSGKTRLMNLITKLSNGKIVNSLTEAVLFRTSGCLGIDEFEAITKKGIEGLKELLNSAYKKGTKVMRMKKVKRLTGEEQVVEEFEVYRPIVIANISGMDEVLGDRCFHIILDKSNNPIFTKKVEIFNFEEEMAKVCSLCSVVIQKNIYKGIETTWNDYLTTKYTNYTTTLTTLTTLTTQANLSSEQLSFFNKIDDSNINGRSLELSFPLLFLANFLNVTLFEKVLQHLKNLDEEKKQEDITESYDVSLLDFVASQVNDNRWFLVSELARQFKIFLNTSDEEINPKWMGKALIRSNLELDKKRKHNGIMVKLNINKAEEKIKTFQPQSEILGNSQ
jgi:hypothetical protein